MNKISDEENYCLGKIFLRFTPEFVEKSDKEKQEYLNEIASKIRGFLYKEAISKNNISSYLVNIPEDNGINPWKVMTDTGGKIIK